MKSLITVVVFFALTASAYAATSKSSQSSTSGKSWSDKGTGYVGTLTGPIILNHDVGTKIGIGVHGGMKFSSLFGAGLFYETAATGYNFPNNVSLNRRSHVIAAEANVYPLGDMSLVVGAKIGLSFASALTESLPELQNQNGVQFNNPDLNQNARVFADSSTNFAFGPSAGYHFLFDRHWAAGSDVNLLIVTTAQETTTALNILAGMSYIF